MNKPFTHVSDDDYIDPKHKPSAYKEDWFSRILVILGLLLLAGCAVYFLIQLI